MRIRKTEKNVCRLIDELTDGAVHHLTLEDELAAWHAYYDHDDSPPGIGVDVVPDWEFLGTFPIAEAADQLNECESSYEGYEALRLYRMPTAGLLWIALLKDGQYETTIENSGCTGTLEQCETELYAWAKESM